MPRQGNGSPSLDRTRGTSDRRVLRLLQHVRNCALGCASRGHEGCGVVLVGMRCRCRLLLQGDIHGRWRLLLVATRRCCLRVVATSDHTRAGDEDKVFV